MRHQSILQNASQICVRMASSLLLGGLLFSQSAYANDRAESRLLIAQLDQSMSTIQLRKRYALGIGRFDLDVETEIIGWKINDAWYFGRQDGLDSGLTLVWQQDLKQVSLSKDGLRLTQRF